MIKSTALHEFTKYASERMSKLNMEQTVLRTLRYVPGAPTLDDALVDSYSTLGMLADFAITKFALPYEWVQTTISVYADFLNQISLSSTVPPLDPSSYMLRDTSTGQLYYTNLPTAVFDAFKFPTRFRKAATKYRNFASHGNTLKVRVPIKFLDDERQAHHTHTHPNTGEVYTVLSITRLNNFEIICNALAYSFRVGVNKVAAS